eukprot:747702-Hanusia_phi.AAC.2
MSMQTAEYQSDEDEDSIQHLPSPDSKPCIADCGLPPALGMQSSLGSLFGKPARVGMSKKVFSMADLSSAVNFADNDSCELPGRKAHVEHKKVHQHVPTIEDDDDDIGVDSDAYSDSDEEDLLAKPTLPHTAGSDSVLSKASGMKKSMSSLDFLKASFSGSGDLSPKLPPKVPCEGGRGEAENAEGKGQR